MGDIQMYRQIGRDRQREREEIEEEIYRFIETKEKGN